MRSIEARITAAENSKYTNRVPHCLRFLLNEKGVGYRCEVLRYDRFGRWSAVGDHKSKHLIGREVRDFDSLQETADFIDNYYKTYQRTYGVPCTAQVIGISFDLNTKQMQILSQMDKHMLILGDMREIQP